jgi:hypothetical protein
MPESWVAKLDRADEHVADLRREIRELLASGDFAAITDPTGRERAVRLRIKREIPQRLGVIVGDVIHNTRSALDCLALAASEVGKGGALDDSEERRVQFPISRDEAEFTRQTDGRRSWLPHIRADHLRLIESRQPWYPMTRAGLDSAAVQNAVEHDQLTTLQTLSNIDKHRRIHLTGWYPRDIYAGTPEGITVNWRPGTGDWIHGGVVGTWLLDGDSAETVTFGAYASVELGLRHHLDLGWHNHEVGGFLHGLVGYVRNWVVEPIARQIGRE